MAKSETKTPTAVPANKPSKKEVAPPEITAQSAAEPSDMVIREIMIQKNVSRDKAIEILKNPSK